ncbi:hypothetical protein [Mobilicoccus pelagius]|uniref:TfoX N-terminal domain-containing protein n=1 Tax=Mobilicoccus pelagius NBRC 104925 TaxID=1089455 RepID=H5UT57_9MICO|nr:hypothetical protein [Mobilicoccus pelagius]GAB48915.1 hypothetical protein MOPEL_085_00010 [Mobilicoccus pelagius NBRC 104925]
MDTHDLFDRMASELAASGVVEETVDGARTLQVDGIPFARLAEGGAQVLLPEGSPARDEALALPSVTGTSGDWVALTDRDVSAWPTLLEQALAGVRR